MENPTQDRSVSVSTEKVFANISISENSANASELYKELVAGNLSERNQKTLDSLLLEGIESGSPTPWTKQDVIDLKERGTARILAKQNRQK